MPDSPRFVLVTGLSGSGKTLALHFLEDLGYYCVDNLPPSLIPTLAELVSMPGHPHRRLAVCVDARAGDELVKLPAYLDAVSEKGLHPEAVFLDSSNAVLIRRYSESRRRHPSAPDGSILEGIERERELLAPVRERAQLILDTSATSVAELRERIAITYRGPRQPRELIVTISSFGFKHGLPPEADMVFDVRFLPNPYYDNELRPLTGMDPAVSDYVLRNHGATEFLSRLQGLLKHLLPLYVAEPKAYLTIAVGCTGGQHRSVAVAHALSSYIRDLGYNVRLRHRDIDRAR